MSSIAEYGTGDTVQKAVDASRPEASTQIMDSRQAVKDVSESQDDYCDSSAGANLLLGESATLQRTFLTYS